VLVMVESGATRCPGVDVTLEAVHSMWEGLASGHGRLTHRRLTVHARGRGAAARRRQAHLWLPAATLVPASAGAGPTALPVSPSLVGPADTGLGAAVLAGVPEAV
jgi:hypothetical protein